MKSNVDPEAVINAMWNDNSKLTHEHIKYAICEIKTESQAERFLDVFCEYEWRKRKHNRQDSYHKTYLNVLNILEKNYYMINKKKAKIWSKVIIGHMHSLVDLLNRPSSGNV